MVRLTPAQMERLSPCDARTSSQRSRVLGTSSSGSASGRAPSLGLATTWGSGPRCSWNSTTWSCFLSARFWWVSCKVNSVNEVCSKKQTSLNTEACLDLVTWPHLIGQPGEESPGDVEKIDGSFYFAVHVLDADQLAQSDDRSVAV